MHGVIGIAYAVVSIHWITVECDLEREEDTDGGASFLPVLGRTVNNTTRSVPPQVGKNNTVNRIGEGDRVAADLQSPAPSGLALQRLQQLRPQDPTPATGAPACAVQAVLQQCSKTSPTFCSSLR